MRFQSLSLLILITTVVSTALPVHADEWQPWIDRNALQNDPRIYCSDVVGQQTQVNTGSYNQNAIGSIQSSASSSYQREQYRNRQGSGSAGLGIGRFQIGASGRSNRTQSERTANASERQFGQSWDNSYQGSHDRTRITSEVVGQNCDAFVQSGALVEATQINAETDRMGIQTQERMNLLQRLLGW